MLSHGLIDSLIHRLRWLEEATLGSFLLFKHLLDFLHFIHMLEVDGWKLRVAVFPGIGLLANSEWLSLCRVARDDILWRPVLFTYKCRASCVWVRDVIRNN